MTFIDRKLTLSGEWEGRDVIWSEGTGGNLLLDSSPLSVPMLDAGQAEQFSISKGTVRNLEDLLYAEGITEYHLVGKNINDVFIEYKKTWRKDFSRVSDLWEAIQLYSQWATGDETERYLNEQLKAAKRIIRIIRKTPAVAMRMTWKYRVQLTLKYFENMIEQIEETIKDLKDSKRSPGKNRGGGGGGIRG